MRIHSYISFGQLPACKQIRMFSVNIPVPPAVNRLAATLSPELADFETRRQRYTLVGKRIGTSEFEAGREPNKDRAVAELRERLRPLIADTDPFRIRAAGIDCFERPARGPGPVVYLDIDSPRLLRFHRRLCRVFQPVEQLEGDNYVPHVTLARGGSHDTATSLPERDVDPIEWTVTEIELFDPEFREPAGTIRL